MALGPEDLALIGQEMVPVEKETERDKKLAQKSQKNEKAQDQFQAPAPQRPAGSPLDQMYLKNNPGTKQNDENSEKEKGQRNDQLSMVPNGPPVSYGPSGSPQAPLFTPEQIGSTRPRNSSSLLPWSGESFASGDLSRLQSFFQGLLPGFDQSRRSTA